MKLRNQRVAIDSLVATLMNVVDAIRGNDSINDTVSHYSESKRIVNHYKTICSQHNINANESDIDWEYGLKIARYWQTEVWKDEDIYTYEEKFMSHIESDSLPNYNQIMTIKAMKAALNRSERGNLYIHIGDWIYVIADTYQDDRGNVGLAVGRVNLNNEPDVYIHRNYYGHKVEIRMYPGIVVTSVDGHIMVKADLHNATAVLIDMPMLTFDIRGMIEALDSTKTIIRDWLEWKIQELIIRAVLVTKTSVFYPIIRTAVKFLKGVPGLKRPKARRIFVWNVIRNLAYIRNQKMIDIIGNDIDKFPPTLVAYVYQTIKYETRVWYTDINVALGAYNQSIQNAPIGTRTGKIFVKHLNEVLPIYTEPELKEALTAEFRKIKGYAEYTMLESKIYYHSNEIWNARYTHFDGLIATKKVYTKIFRALYPGRRIVYSFREVARIYTEIADVLRVIRRDGKTYRNAIEAQGYRLPSELLNGRITINQLAKKFRYYLTISRVINESINQEKLLKANNPVASANIAGPAELEQYRLRTEGEYAKCGSENRNCVANYTGYDTIIYRNDRITCEVNPEDGRVRQCYDVRNTVTPESRKFEKYVSSVWRKFLKSKK